MTATIIIGGAAAPVAPEITASGGSSFSIRRVQTPPKAQDGSCFAYKIEETFQESAYEPVYLVGTPLRANGKYPSQFSTLNVEEYERWVKNYGSDKYCYFYSSPINYLGVLQKLAFCFSKETPASWQEKHGDLPLPPRYRKWLQQQTKYRLLACGFAKVWQEIKELQPQLLHI